MNGYSDPLDRASDTARKLHGLIVVLATVISTDGDTPSPEHVNFSFNILMDLADLLEQDLDAIHATHRPIARGG